MGREVEQMSDRVLIEYLRAKVTPVGGPWNGTYMPTLQRAVEEICTRLEEMDEVMDQPSREDMKEYTWLEQGLFEEIHEAEDILAEGLGYPYSENYGWAVGDHTVVTLAMEARRKLSESREPERVRQVWHAPF